MSTILVMGGSTFVSSSLAKYLIKQGYTVDIASRGIKPINYSGYREHIICDRKSKESILAAFEGRNYEFIFDISAYTKEDVEFLSASINTDTLKRYILCSSGAVYKPSNSIIDESFETGENQNWGSYGLDKRAAEEFIINSTIPYIIFRPTYIYGENNNLYRETYFFDRISNQKIIPFPYGNDSITQFIHIDDLVKCFESAMFSKYSNRIYNITHPEIVSFEYLIRTCGKASDKEPILKKIDTNKTAIEARSYFPFRDVTYILDIKKLTAEGLYVPELDLIHGIKKTYEWYTLEKPILHDSRMNKVDELIK